MKINFRLLAKATWEVLKFPLLVLLISGTITLGTLALFHTFGTTAFPIMLVLLFTGLFGFLIYMRYEQLMIDHTKEQQKLVDILSR